MTVVAVIVGDESKSAIPMPMSPPSWPLSIRVLLIVPPAPASMKIPTPMESKKPEVGKCRNSLWSIETSVPITCAPWNAYSTIA